MKNEQRLVISIKNLNKTFYIREKGTRSIRDMILRFYQQKGDIRVFKALTDINFQIYEGEKIGIIGRNGSGKSTLLRLIIGSIKPDSGATIYSEGRIIRLALGLGFDGNISARDNIYMNGSVLGLSFKKIGLLFNDIITFAGLEGFVETPVKHFSNGMVSRLKFSIAVHAQADIFLLDEFFGGVGDIDFQKKSSDLFQNKLIANRTIIFVSHNLNLIRANCDKVLLLDKGHQVAFGNPEEVIDQYVQKFEEEKKLRQIRKKRRQIRASGKNKL